MRSSATALWALVLVSCGPMIELETVDDTGDAGGTATGSNPPSVTITTSTSTSTTNPTQPPMATSVGPSDEETSVGFVPPPADADFPEWCSTIEQDCPPGYKCMPYSNDGGGAWNATMCVEIADNPAGPGEPCMVEGNGVSGIDDCDGTSMCWDVDPETNMGECIEFCMGRRDAPICPDPCDQCSITGDGTLNICLSGCDPIVQDCAEGQACYPYDDSFICAPDASGEQGTVGDPCEFINVCDAGLACLSAEIVPGCMGAAGCCAPFCDAAAGVDPCPGWLPGTVCTPWYEEGAPVPDCVDGIVGVCVLP